MIDEAATAEAAEEPVAMVVIETIATVIEMDTAAAAAVTASVTDMEEAAAAVSVVAMALPTGVVMEAASAAEVVTE